MTARLAADPVDLDRLRDVLARLPNTETPAGRRQAAVLVPLIAGPPPGVLLTRRAEGLRQHAGQVAFPGGRIDHTDAGPEAAALREAAEEIGLQPAEVSVIGRLPCLVTGTGYHVTPVVGVVRPGAPMSAAPAEVASIFVLPLAVLRDPAAPMRHRALHGDRWSEYWQWPHDEHHIWGATAAILVELAAALNGPS